MEKVHVVDMAGSPHERQGEDARIVVDVEGGRRRSVFRFHLLVFAVHVLRYD